MPVICCSRNLLTLSRWRNNRSWSKRFVKRKVEHWRMIPFTSRCLSTFPKFTNEVQHLVGENFSRGIIPQALARGIVVGLDQLAKALLGQGGQVGLAGQEAAHSADGVLHLPFLPGGADIAEEGLDTQGMELVMPGELGAVVEGDTPAPLGWEGARMEAIAWTMGSAALPGARRAMSRREWRSWRLRSCASTLEQPSMARDPDLPRFGAVSAPRYVVGKFHIVLQW